MSAQVVFVNIFHAGPFIFPLFSLDTKTHLISAGYLSEIIHSLFLLYSFFSMFCSLQRSSIQTQTKMILRLKRSFKKFQWHMRCTVVVVVLVTTYSST